MYKTILFDLDGTLTDPGLGITNAVAHALQKAGRPVPPREQLYKYIGPPLLDSFERFEGMTPAEARQAVGFYREYFVPTGMFENMPYPGVEALLAHLRAAGRTLLVATSKPEPFAVRILEHFGLARYFDHIVGSTLEETRTAKAEVIEYALRQAGVEDKGTAVMVGDRDYDVRGAREAGLGCIGVLFGYGSAAELTAAGALAVAADMPELERLLLSERTSFLGVPFS